MRSETLHLECPNGDVARPICKDVRRLACEGPFGITVCFRLEQCDNARREREIAREHLSKSKRTMDHHWRKAHMYKQEVRPGDPVVMTHLVELKDVIIAEGRKNAIWGFVQNLMFFLLGRPLAFLYRSFFRE